MSINQNNDLISQKYKNIFVKKEEKHNFLVLVLSILLIIFASLLIYWCLKIDYYFEIVLAIFLYSFAFFKIITTSMLIIKLKAIKNDIEPKRLNSYIYQSSWIRKKTATPWIMANCLTIISYMFFISLIIKITNNNLNNYLFFVFYGLTIIMIALISLINYKTIDNNLTKTKKYISPKIINSNDNILEENRLTVIYKKTYFYLLFSLFIIPWFLMLNHKFRTKFFNWINQ